MRARKSPPAIFFGLCTPIQRSQRHPSGQSNESCLTEKLSAGVFVWKSFRRVGSIEFGTRSETFAWNSLVSLSAIAVSFAEAKLFFAWGAIRKSRSSKMRNFIES